MSGRRFSKLVNIWQLSILVFSDDTYSIRAVNVARDAVGANEIQKLAACH